MGTKFVTNIFLHSFFLVYIFMGSTTQLLFDKTFFSSIGNYRINLTINKQLDIYVAKYIPVKEKLTIRYRLT